MNDAHSAPDALQALSASLRRLETAVLRAEPSEATDEARAELERARAALERLRNPGTQASEPSLTRALKAGGMGTWSWELESGLVIWSPTLEMMHGLEPGTFDGTFEGYQRDIHPEDRDYVLTTIQETVTKRSGHRLQYRIVRPDGEVRWLEARGRVESGPDGESVRVLGVCGDITERKLAELAASESESWLATTLASIGDAVIATDPEGRVRFVNDVAAELIGRSADEAKGKPLEEVFVILNESTRAQVENPVAKALRTDGIVGLANHTILVRPDGTEIAIDDSAAPIRDSRGKTIGVVLVFRDVSERRQEEIRENFIAQATALLSSFLDYDATISNIVRLAVPRVCDWCAVDLIEDDGQIRRVGVAHVDPRKVMFAHELAQRWPPDPDAPRGVPAVLRSGETEWVAEISQEVIEAVARDDEHRRIILELGLRSYVVAPMRAHGKTLGAVTFVNAESDRRFDRRDVWLAEELANVAAISLLNAQLHRRTQEALRTTEVARDRAAELQKVTAMLAGAMSAEDVAGAAVSIAHEVTEAAATVAYVRSGGEFRLAAHRDLPESVEQRWPVLPLDAPLPLAHALATGEPQWLDRAQLLERYPHLAGTDVLPEALEAVAALPLSAAGTLLGGLAFSFGRPHQFEHDEREFLLAMARQFGLALQRVSLVEELRRTVRFSEMFIGVLSHDLRNPLSSIVTAAAVLRAKTNDEGLTPAMSRIQASAERMSRMIDQLLDFTRIRLGEGLPLRPTAVDARDLCERVVAELQGAEGDEITIRRDGDTAAQWDGDRVSQLLSNLVANALQHREFDPRISIRIDGTDAQHVAIVVANSGVIPAGLLPRLFEPLATRTDGRKIGTDGLGLGLYIAQEIAQAHGGRIEARSSDGEGTTFTVTLPRRARPGTQPVFAN